MRSGNPTLSSDVFRIESPAASATMTIGGTVTKTAILLALTVGAAAVSWMQVIEHPEHFTLYLYGGSIAGLVIALITTFKPTAAPITAPLYAVAEGLALGGISWLADNIVASRLPGSPPIVAQAVALTFGTLASLLVAYRLGLIRATETFKKVIIAATGGIMLFYVVSMVLRLFGVTIPYIHESGMIGIGFSLFVTVVAALNLVLDFDFIEQGARQEAPKYMEWYGGFALLTTLVWLYVEFLRLLMKLQSRD